MKKKVVKRKAKPVATGCFFITGMLLNEEVFTVGIRKNNEIIETGSFSKGLKEKEKQALMEIIKKKSQNVSNERIQIDPGICIELQFQTLDTAEKLVEPVFVGFRTDMHWEDCTWGQLVLDNIKGLPEEVQLTNPNKPVWEAPFVNKEQFLTYLHEISPYMLPYLKDKLLTVIRFPHGVHGEAFYQKNSPEYAPKFIETFEEEDIDYIHCKDLFTLMWLGNQLALEYHVPFHPIGRNQPTEIVFDLDPPSADFFSLAVKAAIEMHKLFDKFHIISFPKLSGNKGLQIHIPIHQSPVTYEDARVFTSFIAHYLVEKFPKDFTVERMKKNRGNKLYIDYVQHWYGKTIICPYSTRGKEGAKVAAPLYWEEVNETLDPFQYTIFSMVRRINEVGCPWEGYFTQTNSRVKEIITSLKKNK